MDRAAVIEVLDRAGQVRAVHPIRQWPARIGRSPGCEVVLDDAHLAGAHAELHWSEEEGGGASLRLLPSLNGGWLGERRLQAGEQVALAGTALFQLGASQLRWRSTAEPLAPELPLEKHQQRDPARRGGALTALLLLFLAVLGIEQWLKLNPGAPWIDYGVPVLAMLAAVLVWAALWSLVTQLFQHRFPFAAHLWRALLGLLALQLLDTALPALAYAMSWPRLMALEGIGSAAVLAALLWWHASLVWPRGRRRLAFGLVALLGLAGVVNVAKRQNEQYWFGPSYLSQLPPPALRLVAPKTPAALIDSLRPLEAELAKAAARDKDDGGADEED